MNQLLNSTTIGIIWILASAAASAEWHRFRGPEGNGYVPGNVELVTELGEKTTAWTAALPGRGLGSAIIVGDKVFVSAASGPQVPEA